MATINNATIVDVRTPEEYAEGHFPNAINIPLDQVQQRFHEFKNMKKPVIAYCRSGNRSGLAVSILLQAGLKEIENGGSLDDLLQSNK
jgi:phage shock protein E